jgi:hypothetical protein
MDDQQALPFRSKRQRPKMHEMVALMTGMQRQNEELINMLRGQVAQPSATPPDKAEAEPPRHRPKRSKKQLRSMKAIGSRLPADVVERFHTACRENRLAVYEGLEAALLTWLELDSPSVR